MDDLWISDLSLIPALFDLSSLNSSKILVKEEYGSLTLIRVVVIFSVGSKSFATIVAEASVEYIYSVYFGLAKNVSEPFYPPLF